MKLEKMKEELLKEEWCTEEDLREYTKKECQSLWQNMKDSETVEKALSEAEKAIRNVMATSQIYNVETFFIELQEAIRDSYRDWCSND